jgi:hypothetical protein
MIVLFTKCGRGWFWEMLAWLTLIELGKVIGEG